MHITVFGMITMHHLFELVLGQKDLSRAGDLFSLDDYEIESSLSDALEQIKTISSSMEYQTNDNDQAVVEICITRITTAIRETESIEKHGKALVLLWESCLEHNLKSAAKDEDTPHGKIASDIMSCILQNYNRPTMMSLAVPVAVKFLQRGNKELCRNLSNYISLAAIAKADMLAKHTEAILSSILQGNSMLLRVLPSVYEMQPHPINHCLRELVLRMPQLEEGEQHHLLRLLQEVSKRKQPKVLTETLPFLLEYISDPSYSDIILNIFIEISAYEPHSLAGSLSTLKEVGDSFPCLIGPIAKIYGAVGHADETLAKICLTYLVNQLTNMEHSFHHILLLEIRNIIGTFNDILGSQNSDMCRMSNSFTAIAKILHQQLGNNTAQTCRTDSNIETESAFYAHDAQERPFHGAPVKEMIETNTETIHDQKMIDTCTESPCKYVEGKTCKEDKTDKTISRSKLIALNSVNRTCLSAGNTQETENSEILNLMHFSHMFIKEEEERLQSTMDTDRSQTDKMLSLSPINNTLMIKTISEPNQDIQSSTNVNEAFLTQHDNLFFHLKEHINELKNYVVEMVKTVPIPDQCIIEGFQRKSTDFSMHSTC